MVISLLLLSALLCLGLVYPDVSEFFAVRSVRAFSKEMILPRAGILSYAKRWLLWVESLAEMILTLGPDVVWVKAHPL